MKHIKFNNKKIPVTEMTSWAVDKDLFKLYTGLKIDQEPKEIPVLNNELQKKLKSIVSDFVKESILNLDSIIEIIKEIKDETKKNKS